VGADAPVFATTTPEVAMAGLGSSRFAGARLEEVSGDWLLHRRLGLARSREGSWWTRWVWRPTTCGGRMRK